MAKILVTGVSGFVGKHLTRELKSRGHVVLGAGRDETEGDEIAGELERYLRCDLTSADDVARLPLAELDAVINLAGLANVGASFKDPDLYNQVNVGVLSVLGHRMAEEKSRARLIAVSTGAVYDPRQTMPLTESSRVTNEGSPYASSKLLMEKAAAELREKGLDCIVVRPFNHIGPGQEPGFLVPDLYGKIEKSLKENTHVEVGNLKTKRDYTDVRDVVRAYADLATADLASSLYNVCSSRSVAGEKILEHLLEFMGAAGRIQIRVNPEFIRPNDPADLYGSYNRLESETGWTPQIKIEQTIKDFVESKRN